MGEFSRKTRALAKEQEDTGIWKEHELYCIFMQSDSEKLFFLQQAFSTVGTPDYIAPEVLVKKGYGVECDWLVFLLQVLLQNFVIFCSTFPVFQSN